jgi:trk system potassium uptake protein TrkA
MRIVIAGAGDVGTHLVQKLAKEQHALSVVDMSQDKLDLLSTKYDVTTFRGNCLSFDNLQGLGVPNADLFVGVTEAEELNMMTAILAKRMGAKRVIARVRHSKLMQHNDVFDLKGLGLDELISPDALAAEEIEMLLNEQVFSDLIKFEGGKYYLVGLPVKEDGGCLGKTLTQITEESSDGLFVPVAALHDDETVLVSEYEKCTKGDFVFFIAQHDGVVRLAHLTHGSQKRLKRAMILGGSRAGIETARRLQRKKYQVTIVERNRAFAEELAGFLPGVLVIYGDTRETGFLQDHDIEETDALIAATGDPELNIVSCIVAKKHGVEHTIALVKDYHYLHITHEFGVDTLINKKMIAADFIVRHVKKGHVLSVASVPGVDMETLEFQVKQDSEILGKKPFELELCKHSLVVIGGVIRKGSMLPVTETLTLKINDRVIAACHSRCREEFERLL